MERLRAAFTPWLLALLLMLALLGIRGIAAGAKDESTQLERRAQQVLSRIDGAGAVSVAIYIRKVEEQKKGMGLTPAEQEKIPIGVVAVAKGATDPFVCAQLTQALCALLGLPASSVSVISGG